MRKARFAAIYAALWTPVALGFSFALAISERLSWGRALVAGIMTALPAAALGLGVLRLCERFPWRSTSGAALLGVHVAGALAYAVLWSAAIVTGMWLGAPRATAETFMRGALAWQLLTGVITYALLAGAWYARAALRGEAQQTQAAERAEMLRLRAELGALRARLDPHFLFNVLQTIGALVKEKPEAVHTALEYLSSLLRRRIDAAGDDTADGVPFSIELADAREYLALEKLRLGERLHVAEDIDPATLPLMIPRFMLQPLVENAIQHGLAPRAGNGRLVIRSSANGVTGVSSHASSPDNASWTLTVSDDGAGADMVRVASSNGVGLSVLRERLRLRFGADASVSVETAPGNGCAVTVRFPVTDE